MITLIAAIEWVNIQQYVWLLAMLVSLPMFVLAGWLKVFPSRRMLLLATIPCAATTLIFTGNWAMPLVFSIDVGFAAICLADLALVPRKNAFEVRRESGRIASLTKRHDVTLHLTNTSKASRTIDVKDDIPDSFEAFPDDFTVDMEPRSRMTLTYQLKPLQRGAFQMECVFLRTLSRLRLWNRMLTLSAESIIHVYPDMQQLSEYALLARTNRLSLMGVRRTRQIGQDNEFERLRDYTVDDNYKHIDWRTTARRNKLTVKDFQANQSQQVIFMLDCGRMMTNEADGISLLDHALNAMLMMSYVALQQGDSVGLICFSDRVHTYVPPKGGMGQMNQLLHASFDRFPQLVESRYDEAFLYLGTRCKRRALVILISNVIDEVNSMQIQQYLSTLVGRHLPMGVLLRDQQLFKAADAARVEGEEFYQAGAAAEIITWRHQVLRDMEHNGVLAVDVFPRDMTAKLVNQYLQVKARHLL